MTQGNTEKCFEPLTQREKWLTGEIVGNAIKIHKAIGPGLLESIYEKCFCYELAKKILYINNNKWFKLFMMI